MYLFTVKCEWTTDINDVENKCIHEHFSDCAGDKTVAGFFFVFFCVFFFFFFFGGDRLMNLCSGRGGVRD